MSSRMKIHFSNQITGYLLTTPALAALLSILCMPAEAQHSYSFTKLATLGDPAPGGGFHANDFEPGAINNRGDVIYGTDLATSSDASFREGVFLRRSGQAEVALARANGTAPGGGIFDVLLLGGTTLNDSGGAAFAFTLQPFGQPTGVNSGLYRLSPITGNVTPVVVPDVTPAPAGGQFRGVGFNTSLNNKGDLVFSGIIATDKGVHVPGEDYIGLGVGVFKADARDQISSVVSPGDAAPGGGVFDYAGASGAGGASINQAGDVAFAGHVAGEEVPFPTFPPQAQLISALGSLYVKDAQSGKITSIAHAGDPAPCGGTFREIPSLVLNNSGDVAFVGDISPAPNVNQPLAVFLHSKHSTVAVACPNDLMPGGGRFDHSGFGTSLNNADDVVFNAVLNTNTGGIPDTGLYVWSHGSVGLVARTGTVIPGVGTISLTTTGTSIFPPPPAGSLFPLVGPINDHGQILFGVTLTDGRGVLLIATPNE